MNGQAVPPRRNMFQTKLNTSQRHETTSPEIAPTDTQKQSSSEVTSLAGGISLSSLRAQPHAHTPHRHTQTQRQTHTPPLSQSLSLALSFFLGGMGAGPLASRQPRYSGPSVLLGGSVSLSLSPGALDSTRFKELSHSGSVRKCQVLWKLAEALLTSPHSR